MIFELYTDIMYSFLFVVEFLYYVLVFQHRHEDRYPDNKVHGANMGPIWGRQDLGGPHVGPMNFAIWVCMYMERKCVLEWI